MTEISEILRLARVHRPECVLELDHLYEGRRINVIWRSEGLPWSASHPDSFDSEEFLSGGGSTFANVRDEARLESAIREGRVLGLNAPEAKWCMNLVRAALAAEQKGAEDSWYGFKKGERVRWGSHPEVFRVVGPAEDTTYSELLIEREDGKRNTSRDHGYFYGGAEVLQRVTDATAATPAPSHPNPVEAKREDPYAVHLHALQDRFGIAFPHAAMDQLVAAETKQHDFARIANMKPSERRKMQAREMLERPLASAHPKHWPAGSFDDVDELGCS